MGSLAERAGKSVAATRPGGKRNKRSRFSEFTEFPRSDGGMQIQNRLPRRSRRSLAWLTVACHLGGKAVLAVSLAIWFKAGRRRSRQVTLTTAILGRFGATARRSTGPWSRWRWRG